MTIIRKDRRRFEIFSNLTKFLANLYRVPLCFDNYFRNGARAVYVFVFSTARLSWNWRIPGCYVKKVCLQSVYAFCWDHHLKKIVKTNYKAGHKFAKSYSSLNWFLKSNFRENNTSFDFVNCLEIRRNSFVDLTEEIIGKMTVNLPKEMWITVWSYVDFKTLQKSCVLVSKGQLISKCPFG